MQANGHQLRRLLAVLAASSGFLFSLHCAAQQEDASPPVIRTTIDLRDGPPLPASSPDVSDSSDSSDSYDSPDSLDSPATDDAAVVDTSRVQTGEASYYAHAFQGRRTASGEPYDMNALSAAHRTLPLGTYARVTNVAKNQSVIVRINDRGPFVAGRVIDLSFAAATLIGLRQSGRARVTIEPVSRAEALAEEPLSSAASAIQGKRGASARKSAAKASKPTKPTKPTKAAKPKRAR